MHLVLIGGGHAHALLLRRLATQPRHTFHKITLISPRATHVYSGMIASVIAGDVPMSCALIDIAACAYAARVQWIRDEAVHIDGHTVFTKSGHSVHFDVASLNVGSSRRDQHVCCDVPHALLRTSEDICMAMRAADGPDPIAVVGGGAAGIEVASALAARRRLRACSAPVYVISAKPELLASSSLWPREKHACLLRHGGFVPMLGHTVRAVFVHRRGYGLTLDNGDSLHVGHVIWLTGPSAPKWLQTSNIATCPDGYALVHPTLVVHNAPHIFAVGDCRTHIHAPTLDRSGVHAVHEAPILLHNVCAYGTATRLRPYRPRKRSLYLVRLGHRRAMATWGSFWAYGAPLYTLKRAIDSRYVRHNTAPIDRGS
ncbi:MAG: FAD-dependent oxidoreductase [Paenibacillaceae bacterium]|nr:FAD-dependent oxidoreductase [Paenibacillaceae bacterium]